MLPFAELVRQAYFARVSALGDRLLPDAQDRLGPRRRCKGRPFYYFAYGAAVSEVAIDTLTGEYRLLRVDILHDVGRSLNPAIDIGQIEGGFVQGMGWLTTEELWWNEQGRLTHARAVDLQDSRWRPTCPPIFNVRLCEGEQRRGHDLPLQGRGRAAADAGDLGVPRDQGRDRAGGVPRAARARRAGNRTRAILRVGGAAAAHERLAA